MKTAIHRNNQLSLEFDSGNGALLALRDGDANFIAPLGSTRPLFDLQFRDGKGFPTRLSSSDFPAPRFSSDSGPLEIHFDAWSSHQVRMTVTVALNSKTRESTWQAEIEHGREGYLEWMELPRIVVPNNLIATGGDGRLFWPVLEGLLIEDLEHREKSPIPYLEIEYPNHGWCGYYPGTAAFQFLAYENAGKVLYFASHDPEHITKEIEYVRDADGVRMIQKVYLDAAPAGKHRLPFSLVLAVLDGDWHAAAERYRQWMEGVSKFVRITERKDVPSWLGDSPFVVTYPVTGVGHHSGKTSPNEFFPFTRALPVLEKLGAELDSRLLVLLMHWEGTAPWAPPYVWPPLGGEQGMKDFANELHARNHLLGLYCSGTAWTNTADTGDGTYNRTEELERDHLLQYMCRGPKGDYACKICNGEGIRLGYDMCPATPFVRDVIAGEAEKIARAGVDYIQLFDQNLGGAAYQCYDSAHGHPGAPGAWGAKAMLRLLSHVRERLVKAGKGQMLLGCEAAAAEPYLHDLPINDLRFQMGFWTGKPVPAYAYLFHEYGCNFMGNQVEILAAIDEKAHPYNLALRMAYSFIAGDLLTLVLKDKGEFHWSWCTKWEVPPPPQASHLAFAKHLNAWRRGAGHDFLFGGRMLAPANLTQTEDVELGIRWAPRPLHYQSVLTSHWQSTRGERAHFLVNFLDRPQRVRLRVRQGKEVCLLSQPFGDAGKNLLLQKGEIEVEIAGLSAVMVREEV